VPGKFSPHGFLPDIRAAALRSLAAIFAAIMQAIGTGAVCNAPILEFIVDACIFAHMGRLLSILKNRKGGSVTASKQRSFPPCALNDLYELKAHPRFMTITLPTLS
jgi:hypothetical protein